MIVKRLLNSESGSTIISVLLGLGLAALFKKACNDNNCLIIKGPPYKKIKDKIFIYEDKCFVYSPKATKCSTTKIPDDKYPDTNQKELTEEDLTKDNFSENKKDLFLGF